MVNIIFVCVKNVCNFIDLPEPSGPFPRVNDTAALKGELKKIKIMSYITIYGLPVLTAGIAAGITYYCKGNMNWT